MNFAKRLPLIALLLLGSCATKEAKRTHCGHHNALMAEISAAHTGPAFKAIERKLSDQSDIYLLYHFHLRRGELESNPELARAYTEYAREIAMAHPEIHQCEENLK